MDKNLLIGIIGAFSYGLLSLHYFHEIMINSSVQKQLVFLGYFLFVSDYMLKLLDRGSNYNIKKSTKNKSNKNHTITLLSSLGNILLIGNNLINILNKNNVNLSILALGGNLFYFTQHKNISSYMLFLFYLITGVNNYNHKDVFISSLLISVIKVMSIY